MLSIAAGCGDEEPPGCRVGTETQLPATTLTGLADVRLHRVADGFALVGLSAAGDSYRVASLSATGELGRESEIALPPRVLGPFHGLVGQAAPGDQLLVVTGAARPATPGMVALQLSSFELAAGTPASTDPRPLRDSQGREVVVEVGSDPTRFFAAMGGSRSGMRAAFAWGRGDRPSAPEVVLLRGNGEAESLPTNLAPMDAPWDCLAITGARSALGVSWIGRSEGRRPIWHFADMREDASVSYALDVEVNTREMGCPAVAPTSKGYTFAWQNGDGTYFSFVDTTRDEVLLVSDIVKAAVRFGGPDRQPRVACIAPMGREFGIVYDASGGALVDRFDVFGNPRGGSLYLPNRGRVDRLSGWVDVDTMFLTYADRGKMPALDTRYFVRIDCPSL
jgi:hypothetical protein